jgi:hypothetical protein
LLALFALASPAAASEEEIHNWKSATMVATTSLFGAVEVKATADAGGSVQTLAVIVKRTTITIPEKWLKSLGNLPVASMQVRTESGHDPHPWLYIYFRTPSTPTVHVHIAIQNGKLVRASIVTTDAKGKQAKYEERKAP